MTEAKTKSVNMTFPALFSYVMNTNYRSMSGILGLVLSFGAIVMLVIGWNATSGRQKAIFIIVALMFTVINPLSLAFKTFKQLKTSPSTRDPYVLRPATRRFHYRQMYRRAVAYTKGL